MPDSEDCRRGGKAMVYQRREYPEWSWSLSRAHLFSQCKRKYYYHYYAAHNGWERTAPSLARQAYRLKQLTNLHFVFGDAMHQAASYAVANLHRENALADPQALTQHIRRKLNGSYLSSRRPERWLQSPNKHPMLHEFYYGDGLPEPLVARIRARIPVCLEHLLASETLQELKGLSPSHIIENDDAQPFTYHDSKVYAIPDLLYTGRSGELVIVDWKTGDESEQYLEQVTLYALYAKVRYGAGERLLARIEYLDQGRKQEVQVTPVDLHRAHDLILSSRAEMQGLLADPEENQALGVEHFPLTVQRDRCRWCNFFEFCREQITREGEKSG